MYYLDLTNYEYLLDTPDPRVRNVGWIEPPYEYTRGQTPGAFQRRLFDFCRCELNKTRGFHACGYCGFWGTVDRAGVVVPLGSTEVWAFYDNVFYAAPSMIYHYVVSHEYCPPEAFIQAILHGPSPEGKEYHDLLSSLNIFGLLPVPGKVAGKRGQD